MNGIISKPKESNAGKTALNMSSGITDLLPPYVIDGIKKGIEQTKLGKIKSVIEVKEILANRWA
ncbi:MAG: hypothetical protein EAZ15_00135 [Sphingobacteriales bacterium]|nr:MAG: hypothetical protein EAZ15_00135 [Sphingobacteriales bacterium]